MGTLRERPPKSGRWELRVSAGRDPRNASRYVQRSKVFYGNKTEAKKALNEFEAKVGGTSVSTGTTFAALIDRWIETGEAGWSVTTTPTYRAQLDRYVIPAWGTIPIHRITTEDVDRLYASLLKGTARHKALSPATVLRVHANCSAAFNQAVRWGWLKENPCDHAKKPRQASSLKTRRDLPELEDVLAMFEAAIERDPVWGRFLLAKIGIGARRGEMAGLQLRSVDFDSGLVSIERQVVQPANGPRLRLKDVKSGNRRTIEVDANTLAVLKAQRDYMADRADTFTLDLEAFLWSDDLDGARPWKPDRITQRFGRLAKPVESKEHPERNRAGLKLRLHDLRHFNGTLMAEMGVDLATIAYRLGHTRLSTSSDFYVERINAGDARAAGLLGQRLTRSGNS